MKQQILELRSQGKTYKFISEKLGCSQGTISYHCGEGQKEKSKNRLSKNRKNKCSCGKEKSKKARSCKSCSYIKRRNLVLNRPIKDFERKYSNIGKFATVRTFAKIFMEENNVEKKCQICGFNEYVEVCHIKSISSFDKNSPLSEVNSLENLIYLCPNHHVLLDLGKIDLK